MPYRFKSDEPVEQGFRRIAGEQLDAALSELAGAEVGPANIHQCRKALKRLRALIRLAADAIGNGKARRRTRSLGDIARLLSARRDQTVMLETIASLSEENAEAATALEPVKRDLVAHSGDRHQVLDPEIADRARMRLLREAKKLNRARFAKRGFAALEGGLKTSYRKGRKAARFAYEEPTDENFHELRKAVQWHWRQMSLLARAWPDEFAVRVNAARELSQLLGDDHDLAMLVAATGQSPITADEKEAAVAVCRRKQQMLRADAEHRIKRLFAEKPRAFVARMEAYWRSSPSFDPRLEVPAPVRQVPAAEPVAKKNVEAPAAVKEKRPPAQKPRLAAKSEAPAPSQQRA